MTNAARLRSGAEDIAATLPALMADAEQLAASIMLGEHGRRRPGLGDEFWQYRPAMAGDAARMIDWRRSGRSDAQFVQEKEWQAAQSIEIWVDDGQSMAFSSDKNLPTKGERARLLGLAISVLLIRGGERVALASLDPHPRQGEQQLMRIAAAMVSGEGAQDYAIPNNLGLIPYSRAVFLSDFFGDIEALEKRLGEAADRGVRGVLLQVLDPVEEAFPFDGRTIFESVGKSVSHETLKASDLRDRYLARLQERKTVLGDLARSSGWQYHCHHSSEPAQAALLWIYRAIERAH